jgi:hypothetical protein
MIRLEKKMLRVASYAVLVTVVVLFANAAVAQRAGQSSSIRSGIVTGKQNVDLNNNDALKGALVGGAIGAAVTSSSKSSRRRNQNALIGAALGTARGASKRNPGSMYSVRVSDGTIIKVATEQTEIQINDCVLIEESGGTANIRRTASATCEEESAAVMNSPEMQEELQEEAAECSAAKAEMLEADDADSMDLAVRKVQILCYN